MTTRENLQMQYWQMAEPETVLLSNNVVRDMVVGKKSSDLCKLSLLHNLWFYLDIIQQQQGIDLTNGLFYSIDYYKDLFCINSIKKHLRCTGIDAQLLSNLIDLYLMEILYGNGIGSMIIQGASNPFHVRTDSGQAAGYPSYIVPVNSWNTYITYIINNYFNQCCTIKVFRRNIAADSTFLTILPAGYKFNEVVFVNTKALYAQLSMGSTPGGVEAFGSMGLNALDPINKGLTTLVVNKVFDLVNPTTFYLHHGSMGDDWNGAVFNIEFIFEKI